VQGPLARLEPALPARAALGARRDPGRVQPGARRVAAPSQYARSTSGAGRRASTSFRATSPSACSKRSRAGWSSAATGFASR
jgi:hypothetical protein